MSQLWWLIEYLNDHFRQCFSWYLFTSESSVDSTKNNIIAVITYYQITANRASCWGPDYYPTNIFFFYFSSVSEIKELTAGTDSSKANNRLTCASLNIKIMKNSWSDTFTTAFPRRVEAKKMWKGIRKYPHVTPARSNRGFGIWGIMSKAYRCSECNYEKSVVLKCFINQAFDRVNAAWIIQISQFIVFFPS